MVKQTALRRAADQLTEPIAGPGHNLPPTDADMLRSQLARRHAKIAARRDLLIAKAKEAPEINDDDTAGKVTEFLAQGQACSAAAKDAHKTEKAPFLEAGRTVDAFFLRGVVDALDTALRPVKAKLERYLSDKAARERREAEDRARREQEAAEALAASAQTEAELDQAIAHAEQAQVAQVTAQATAAELSRTRSDTGALAGLRTVWDFELEDIAKVPAAYLMVNDTAVRAAIKAGIRAVPGIRIFEKQQLAVRR